MPDRTACYFFYVEWEAVKHLDYARLTCRFYLNLVTCDFQWIAYFCVRIQMRKQAPTAQSREKSISLRSGALLGAAVLWLMMWFHCLIIYCEKIMPLLRTYLTKTLRKTGKCGGHGEKVLINAYVNYLGWFAILRHYYPCLCKRLGSLVTRMTPDCFISPFCFLWLFPFFGAGGGG